MAKPEVFIVQRAFVVDGRRVLRRGTRLAASDPAVKGNERNLMAADQGLVEQATAAPGELRNTPQEPRNTPTKAELLEEAEAKGVKVPSNATKAEIAEAIEEAE